LDFRGDRRNTHLFVTGISLLDRGKAGRGDNNAFVSRSILVNGLHPVMG